MHPHLATICYLFSLAFPALAEGPAGIVLYHHDGAKVQLLLDHAHKYLGWASFGGSAKEGETVEETAARETEEETRGYFKRAWLYAQITESRPARSNGFTMYFVAAPFVPARQVMDHPVDENNLSLTERTHFAWIPLSELADVMEQDSPHREAFKINPAYLPPGCKTDYFQSV